jgi:hypothetical protein
MSEHVSARFCLVGAMMHPHGICSRPLSQVKYEPNQHLTLKYGWAGTETRCTPVLTLSLFPYSSFSPCFSFLLALPFFLCHISFFPVHIILVPSSIFLLISSVLLFYLPHASSLPFLITLALSSLTSSLSIPSYLPSPITFYPFLILPSLLLQPTSLFK